MKDWVKPFIIQEFTNSLNRIGKSEEEKKEKIEQKTKGLENDEVIYYELINLLQCDFGDGLAGDSKDFTMMFGLTLADLPEETFRKLYRMKNVFYIFTPFPGAEVKILNLDENIQEEQLKIVNFPYDSIDMTRKALKGEIAHELAHISLEHITGEDEMEDEADKTVRSWGFEKDLKALKDAHAKYHEEL